MPALLTLNQDIFIGGIRQNAGTQITVDDSLAGALISENKATRPTDFGVDFKQDGQVMNNRFTNEISVVNPNTGAKVTGFSMLRDKLRKAYSDQSAKPYQSTFMNAPAAWGAGQTVSQGEARASNGNWYIALAGGTCGVNPPNLIQPLLTQPFNAWRDGAADGSSGGVPWVFHSVAASQVLGTRDPETTGVTVSFSSTSDAGVTQTIPLVTGSVSSISGYRQATNQRDTNWSVVFGAGTTAALVNNISDIVKSPNSSIVECRQTAGGALGITGHMGNSTATAQNSTGIYWEFNTDSLLFQITTAAFSNGGIRVLVDNVEVSVGNLYSGIAGSNNNLFTLITISGKPKVRNIKIFNTNGIRDIRITGNSQMHFVKDQSIKVLWVGDSISAGSSEGPSKQGMTWVNHTANLLGFKGFVQAASGGTGFEQNNGALYNYLNRLSETVNTTSIPNSIQFSSVCNNFDMVIIQVSGNDNGVSPTLPAIILQTLQQARRLQPDALIIVHGAFYSLGDATTIAEDALARTVFAQWNDPNSFYLRTDAGARGGIWITGTGRNANGQTTATGNSSYYVGADGTHPNDAGLIYLAEKTVESLYHELKI